MPSENHLHSHLIPNMKLQGLVMILVLGFTVVLLSYCIEAKSTHISPIEHSGRELNDEFTDELHKADDKEPRQYNYIPPPEFGRKKELDGADFMDELHQADDKEPRQYKYIPPPEFGRKKELDGADFMDELHQADDKEPRQYKYIPPPEFGRKKELVGAAYMENPEWLRLSETDD
ncbi:uncharacterized protein [Montipora capricornis]|uniref:uncharacterized protein isoform X1 n=1 Tax=Montipora capricornis TaxID=246305 RepID=UPI0035F175F2